MKRYKYYLNFTIILILTVTFHNPTNSQTVGVTGTPMIHNYEPIHYRGEGQNWAITEDQRGVMYVANLDGVLEFDGISWRLIPLPGNLYVTSLAVDSTGTVFVGSHSEFGYLKPNEGGLMEYQSLLHLFDTHQKEFSFIWEILPTSHGVYFYNYDNVFRYRHGEIYAWDVSRYSNIFQIEDEIIISDRNRAQLLRVHEEELIPIKGTEALSHTNYIDILPYGKNALLAIDSQKGFKVIYHILNTDKKIETRPLKNQSVHKLASQSGYMKGNRALSNETFAIGTQDHGLIIIDKEGNPLKIFDKSSGLQNENINAIFEDSQNILWCALGIGVSSINYKIPLTYWNERGGVDGNITSIKSFQNHTYISTWHGIFRLNRKVNLNNIIESEGVISKKRFKKVREIEGIGWSIQPIIFNEKKTGLLVASSTGLYFINPQKEITPIAHNYYLSITQSKSNPNIILAGHMDGLDVFFFDPLNRSFIHLTTIEEFKNFEVFDIVEDQDLFFWISHRFEGISSLKINPDTLASQTIHSTVEYDVTHYNSEHGLPAKDQIGSFKLGSHIIFTSEKGLWYLDKRKDKNVKPFRSPNYFYSYLIKKYASITYMHLDSDDNLWVQIRNHSNRERRLIQLSYNENNMFFRVEPNYLNLIPQIRVNYMYFDTKNNTGWFAADNILYQYDFNGMPQLRDDQKCLIRKISVSNERVYSGAGLQNVQTKSEEKQPAHVFRYNQNTITLEYSLSSFWNPGFSMFSTYLKGSEKTWSPWSSESKITYNNLPVGEYTFFVRGRDLLGNKSEAVYFSFVIQPPWYYSKLAYFIYVILLLILIFAIIRLSNYRLRKAKINLEENIKERTHEIAEKQKLLEVEKQKSDQLLQNILPAKIAEELKTNGQVQVQYYELVSVVFIDFKDFSKISQIINPLLLISELDKSFRFFDEIAQKHNLEKIKTMGDAFMCAGGIPEPDETNPFNAILACFEILEFIKQAEKDQWLCSVRIGIHTGEIVAGIIGKNKFAYDIWGESVNTASRMESSGEANRINISGETYDIVKDFFDCTYRGKLAAKHNNEFEMYFVNRLKKKYRLDIKGFKANDLFWEDVEKFIETTNF